jgi:putative transposase
MPESFYHVYAAGANRQRIFREAADFEKFLQLFARYLSLKESQNVNGQSFPNFYNRLELVAFCLMPTHFHLFVYQHQPDVMPGFMRSLMTSYSMYFNKKYRRSGPLFESRYKASLISEDDYPEHVSRYIHLHPRDWRHYEYSSLPYYLQQISDDWVRPERIMERFKTPADYLEFVQDQAQAKEMIDILKYELAADARS